MGYDVASNKNGDISPASRTLNKKSTLKLLHIIANFGGLERINVIYDPEFHFGKLYIISTH